MEKGDLEYLIKLLWKARELTKLGAHSEHHMEQVIFRELNDQLRSITDFAEAKCDDK